MRGASAFSKKARPVADGIDLNFTVRSISFREGDVLVVWKLDRLSRSLKDLCRTYSVRSARGLFVPKSGDTKKRVGITPIFSRLLRDWPSGDHRGS
jgi:hypothetical protein